MLYVIYIVRFFLHNFQILQTTGNFKISTIRKSILLCKVSNLLFHVLMRKHSS